MTHKKIFLSMILTLFVLSLFILTAGNLVANTQEVIVQPYKTIPYNPPPQFIPGAEDKAGYWYQKDYGIVEAFDFSLVTNLLAAAIKEFDSPTRLFIMDLKTGKVKHKVIISDRPQNVRLSPDGKTIAVATEADQRISLWDARTGTLIDKKKNR